MPDLAPAYLANPTAATVSALSDALTPTRHDKRYVHDNPTCKALHFSISGVQSCMHWQDPVALVLRCTRER